MVTDEQYDGLVVTIQREMAKLYEQNLVMRDEISKQEARILELEKFAPDKKLKGYY